jgi:peptide-methionine (S)-S-oxide reductase
MTDTRLLAPTRALSGRDDAVLEPGVRHRVLGTALQGPWPAGTQVLYLAMGCFWGAEEIYWQVPGVVTTAVGYMGGATPNPTYEEVCTGRTGHTETVLVAYDPRVVDAQELLRIFWEHHDPTQGNRQGNDMGTQYRSAIYATSQTQLDVALASRQVFQEQLSAAGYGPITTEIAPADAFYFAEPYHQQYLGKNPNGYCGMGGTGVSCPIGVASAGN